MSRIDLHIHTNKSDGSLTPKEVINEAIKNNVNIIAIADHDTIDAYTDEIFNYAKENNILLITAVEISTKTEKCGIHILGYNIDINNINFRKKLKEIRNSRHDYLHTVTKKLRSLNYIVNLEFLDKIDAVTKAHIAKDIISNKKNKNELIKQFGFIPEMGEFIETIMNENCPAYVEKKSVTPKKAAEIIRKAGGKVVLAHPVAYQYEDNLSIEEIIKIAKDINADGLEAYYIYTDRNNKFINEIDKWIKIADENNLFVTIGSDFHIKDGYHAEIGLINCEINLDNDMIFKMLRNIGIEI